MGKSRNIEDMKNGQIGWTAPWGIYYNRGKLFINPIYTVNEVRGGASQILIKRSGRTVLVDKRYVFEHEIREIRSWPTTIPAVLVDRID